MMGCSGRRSSSQPLLCVGRQGRGKEEPVARAKENCPGLMDSPPSSSERRRSSSTGWRLASFLLSVERQELEHLLVVEGQNGASRSIVGLGIVGLQFAWTSRYPPAAVALDWEKQ